MSAVRIRVCTAVAVRNGTYILAPSRAYSVYPGVAGMRAPHRRYFFKLPHCNEFAFTPKSTCVSEVQCCKNKNVCQPSPRKTVFFSRCFSSCYFTFFFVKKQFDVKITFNKTSKEHTERGTTWFVS